MSIFFIILAVLLLINILLFQFNSGNPGKAKTEADFGSTDHSYPKPYLT